MYIPLKGRNLLAYTGRIMDTANIQNVKGLTTVISELNGKLELSTKQLSL